MIDFYVFWVWFNKNLIVLRKLLISLNPTLENVFIRYKISGKSQVV